MGQYPDGLKILNCFIVLHKYPSIIFTLVRHTLYQYLIQYNRAIFRGRVSDPPRLLMYTL